MLKVSLCVDAESKSASSSSAAASSLPPPPTLIPLGEIVAQEDWKLSALKAEVAKLEHSPPAEQLWIWLAKAGRLTKLWTGSARA